MHARIAIAVAAMLALTACSATVDGAPRHPTNSQRPGITTTSKPATPPTSRTASPQSSVIDVHVSVNLADGVTVGVGMPYIARFSQRITDGRAFQAATKVTVDGEPADARWYFETSNASNGWVMEAHLRMQSYWPAHAQIHVDLPVAGLAGGSAGTGRQFRFENSLTSDFTTTSKHIVEVSNATHSLTVYSDDTTWGTFPVSLGASDTPTKRGIKVIMEKGKDISMRGPGYYDPHVYFTQRLTYGGEYLHSAPWNCLGSPGCVGPFNNIGSGNSSNGCTNLRPADAKKLYDFLGIGDVVTFNDATGQRMTIDQGYGDWNVAWPQWRTGGIVPTA